MPSVTIVDYGIGNILSVKRAFEHFGATVMIANSADAIVNAERLVLPGVGAFADGMLGLKSHGYIEPIREYARDNKPFLGICLGMQMMLESSEEFGIHAGLGIIPGKVVRLSDTGTDGQTHKIPYVGWNALQKAQKEQNWHNSILANINPGESVYFVHSFEAIPTNTFNRLANCLYDGRVISAAIYSGNLYGCQFHPEKSGKVGLKIIKNFLDI